jgi:hypothetical protein
MVEVTKMPYKPSFPNMRPGVAQLAVFALSFPSWILMLVTLLYPASVWDDSLPMFAIVIVCSLPLSFAIASILCSDTLSRWRRCFLLSWESIPVLIGLVWGIIWVVENWTDISDWVFVSLMNCLYKMITGFGPG